MGASDEPKIKRNKKKDKSIMTRQKIGPYSTRCARIKTEASETVQKKEQSSRKN